MLVKDDLYLVFRLTIVGVHDGIIDRFDHAQCNLMRVDIGQRRKRAEPLYRLTDQRHILQIAGNGQCDLSITQLVSTFIAAEGRYGMLLTVKNLKDTVHSCQLK